VASGRAMYVCWLCGCLVPDRLGGLMRHLAVARRDPVDAARHEVAFARVRALARLAAVFAGCLGLLAATLAWSVAAVGVMVR
jgi:hypothetical protein